MTFEEMVKAGMAAQYAAHSSGEENQLSMRITKGGDVFFLYGDDHPLREAGKLTLERASHVIWDEDTNMWKVELPAEPELPEEWEHKALMLASKRFHRRDQALAYEVSFLNDLLASGFPVEDLFGK